MAAANVPSLAPADRRRAWIVFAVVFFASAVAPFNQSKVPPLIPVLVEQLDLSLVEAGLLQSVFSVAGMVLALPAGLLFRRFGPRRGGVVAVGSVALGSLLGSLAPNGTWLLATRLLEGVGMGISVVLALATIAAWFPPHERAVPIGIFSAWFPVGNLAMLLLAPVVYQAWGWRAVWVVGGVVALICLVLYATLVDLPRPVDEAPRPTGRPPWHQAIRNGSAWLLSLSFACYAAARVGMLTWAPTYLVSQAGMGLAAAAQITGLNQLLAIPASPAGGWILTRVGSGRKLYSATWLVLLPLCAVIFELGPTWFAALFILSGAVMALIPAAVNAAAPETARAAHETGPAVGIVGIGRNAGQVVAPALFAVILEATGGWEGVSVALVASVALGLVSGWLVRVR
jgi:nitrate/nitrite transporter NarK